MTLLYWYLIGLAAIVIMNLVDYFSEEETYITVGLLLANLAMAVLGPFCLLAVGIYVCHKIFSRWNISPDTVLWRNKKSREVTMLSEKSED